MFDYQFNEGRYLTPSPGGAYFAVSSDESDTSRRALMAMMAGERSPPATAENFTRWTGENDPRTAFEFIYRLQELGLVVASDQAQSVPLGPFEDSFPALLAQLSGSGKALLADGQGFYIAAAGFAHESAEEISALSADIAALHLRHRPLLARNLGYKTSAWALVDASGNSSLGLWPLYVGSTRFVLAIAELPQLNQAAFVKLVWSLARRYAVPAQPGTESAR